MRYLAILTLPSLLTSCVLYPFMVDPGTDGSTDEWWVDDDTGEPGGDDTENPYTRTFRPYAVFIGANTVWDGRELTGYNLFAGSDAYQDPYITFMFVEEEYFNSYNGIYSCSWTGKVVPGEPVTFNNAMQRIWGAWRIRVEFLETDCENFDPTEWGDTVPTPAIESTGMAIGYSAMSSDMRDSFRQAVGSWGEEWSDYEPYVFSTWFAFDSGVGTWEATEVDFSFAYELGETGGQVYDENGDTVKVPITGLDAPPEGLIRSEAWMGFYAWVLSN